MSGTRITTQTSTSRYTTAITTTPTATTTPITGTTPLSTIPITGIGTGGISDGRSTGVMFITTTGRSTPGTGRTTMPIGTGARTGGITGIIAATTITRTATGAYTTIAFSPSAGCATTRRSPG